MNTTIFNLQMFADLNTNTITGSTTPGNDLRATRKVYYNTQLLENSRNQNIFVQLGKKQPLPKNSGDKVEWRKFDTFSPAMTPLTEGVTPDGNKINMTKIEAQIEQYGDYTCVSDRLDLEAIDPIIMSVTEEHGAQAGDTMDLLTRNALLAGTHVAYAGGKSDRADLTAADVITGLDVNKWRTHLKKMKAPTMSDGSYVAVIHPSVAEDLRHDSEWLAPHQYQDTTEIYNGEIGKLHGIRFIENINAKVMDATESGASGCVYITLVTGKDAFGVIEPSAESMEVIVKQRGSAGTADPLDQRSTVGWKASTATKILYQERLLRFESGSTYSAIDQGN